LLLVWVVFNTAEAEEKKEYIFLDNDKKILTFAVPTKRGATQTEFVS